VSFGGDRILASWLTLGSSSTELCQPPKLIWPRVYRFLSAGFVLCARRVRLDLVDSASPQLCSAPPKSSSCRGGPTVRFAMQNTKPHT
jgi:hypothetical protein